MKYLTILLDLVGYFDKLCSFLKKKKDEKARIKEKETIDTLKKETEIKVDNGDAKDIEDLNKLLKP